MRSVNKVILIGNLTREPEVKQTQGGQAVATFGIATNREWATREGSRQSSAEFHELVAFARLADICGQFLRKGNLVYIEGYLKTRSWIAEDSTRRFRTEVVVNDMIRLEKRPADTYGAPHEGGGIDHAAFGADAEDAFNASMAGVEESLYGDPANDNHNHADHSAA